MGGATASISGSFALVAVLSVLSRFYHVRDPLYSDPATALPALDEITLGSYDSAYSEPIARPPQADEALSIRPSAARPDAADNLASIHQQIVWMNGLVEPVVPAALWGRLPLFFQSWLRNYIFGLGVYFGVGLVWAYYIYQCFGRDLFPKDNMPSWRDMREQMHVSFWALPLYSLLPSVTEELCARGHTLVYARVSDVGTPGLVAYLFLFMAFVEFGVYWMHRGLHDNRDGYKYLHAVHHKYNKEHSMSPFAGLAFHPLDGILQAFPYAVALFVVPMHFMLHEFLLFGTALWTANIHDNIHGNVLPIMGAGWHTIHHTSYKHNYGHYFVIMDWLFGTLISPAEYAAQTAARRATAGAAKAQ